MEKLQEKENPEPIQKILTKANEKLEANIKPIPVKEEKNTEKTIYRTDKLSKLNKNDRKFLGEIFTIINNVLTKDLAENLISKIEEKYK